MAYPPKASQHAAWSLVGGGYPEVPNELTKWELFLLAEGLEEDNVRNNPKVLDFILKNAHKFYVPTKVLKMYGADFDYA